MDRRKFIQYGAALGVAAGLDLPKPVRRLKRVGLELYSVRTEMGRDPDKTMAAVAKMGYNDVELLWSFGNFGRSVAQVKAALDSNGLKAPSAHMSAATILVGWDRSLEMAKKLGHSYLIVPSFTAETERTIDDWKEWADKFNAAGEKARTAGIWLAFHNEADHQRPIDGQIPFDVFIERTQPNLVRLQLDVGNMVLGGGDPMKYLQRYKARFWSFHIKDVTADGKDDTQLGKGKLNLKQILAAIPDIDNKPCYVEQEGIQGAMENADKNCAYLKALSF